MVTSKFVSLGATLALAAAVTATPTSSYRALRARDYQFIEAVPVEKRQDVSPERFQCHSDCGNTILDSETDGYCDSSAWLGLLDACLECVVEHPIWQWYGEGVQGAAAGCGLSAEPGQPATPIGGGDDEETTSESQPSPTQPPTTPEESTTDTPAPVPTTSDAPQESGSSGEEEEDEEETVAPSYTVPAPSEAPAPSNGTIPSHVPSAAGARVGGSFFAAGALAAAVYIL